MPTEAEIAWAAGFYEGEGYITCAARVYAIHMAVSQNTEWPLVRWGEIVGCGFLHSHTAQRPPDARGMRLNAPIMRWRISKGEDVIRIARLLYPHLSPRRQAQIDTALERYANRLQSPRNSRGALKLEVVRC